MIEGFAGPTMIDRWFPVIKLPMTLRQFDRLPRNPAYRYEYSRGTAWLSPRPKSHGARLALRRSGGGPPREVEIPWGKVVFRRLEDRDWPRFARLFASSFHRVQPFESLSDRRRLDASRDCLKSTRAGDDGPIIHPACHVAWVDEEDRPVGACLVTLVPPVDLEDAWSLRWKEPPPPDAVERRLGHPHLTWIFVSPWCAGYGIGSALLTHASESLMDLGYAQLASSFLQGNDSSLLWHWRNGFELLPYIGSKRRFREVIRRLEAGSTPDTP